MNLFASVKPDAPTPLPLLSHLPPPPAPLTCGSCSGLSSSQQSIIDDAIAQVLGPGATMDSLVQLTPSPRSEVDETPAPAAARRFLPLGMRSIDPQAAGLRALAEAGIQGGGLWAEGTAEAEAAEPEAPEDVSFPAPANATSNMEVRLQVKRPEARAPAPRQFNP